MSTASNSNTVTKDTIEVHVVSAQEKLYAGNAAMVVATAFDGEVGIKPKHAPFLSMLKPGQAVVHLADGGEEVFYISGGTIEVQPNLVTILADDARRGKDIDEAEAQRARQEAERILQDKSAKVDYAKLQVQLAQSMAQLRALRRFRKQAEKRRS